MPDGGEQIFNSFAYVLAIDYFCAVATDMPYRRLPNTDQARLRSLKAALEQVRTVSPADLMFSQKTALEAESFTPLFEQIVQQCLDCKDRQAAASRQVAESGRVARLYLSHFVQVFNMCVARGEIKPAARAMLGLDACCNAVPDLSADKALVDWGHKIVEGEEARMANGGGNRIYNPSIALVKVKLQIFEDNYNKHRDILQTVQKFKDKLEEARVKADEIILHLWNEVEGSVEPVDTDEKREMCQRYGVVYFYRPQERQKEFLLGQI
mgnify:CR=1 FL=1